MLTDRFLFKPLDDLQEIYGPQLEKTLLIQCPSWSQMPPFSEENMSSTFLFSFGTPSVLGKMQHALFILLGDLSLEHEARHEARQEVQVN